MPITFLSIVRAGLLLAALLASAVTGAAQDLEVLRETARRFLLAQQADRAAAVAVEVRAFDPRLALPACASPPEAFLPAGGRSAGNTTVGLRCAGPSPWKVFTGATVRVEKPVVVAARNLRRGEVLGAADLRLARVDTARLAGGFETEPQRVAGMRLQQPLPAGAVVAPGALAEPIAVERGERVTLVSIRGGMVVSMEGVAQTSARTGERVRVRNLGSGKEVEGRIDANRRVIVD